MGVSWRFLTSLRSGSSDSVCPVLLGGAKAALVVALEKRIGRNTYEHQIEDRGGWCDVQETLRRMSHCKSRGLGLYQTW